MSSYSLARQPFKVLSFGLGISALACFHEFLKSTPDEKSNLRIDENVGVNCCWVDWLAIITKFSVPIDQCQMGLARAPPRSIRIGAVQKKNGWMNLCLMFYDHLSSLLKFPPPKKKWVCMVENVHDQHNFS